MKKNLNLYKGMASCGRDAPLYMHCIFGRHALRPAGITGSSGGILWGNRVSFGNGFHGQGRNGDRREQRNGCRHG